MAAGQFNRYWALTALLLITITATGSPIAISRYRPGQPLEISLPENHTAPATVCISGAVINPGYYSITGEDSLDSVLQAAGGMTSSANISGLKLYVPASGEDRGPQKIDINRAEVWLLESLPGIGEILAQRIVDDRTRSGPFQSTQEILRVSGIAQSTYERIKGLITVGE